MKVYKFSIFLVFITLIALLYVHQQIQLIEMSYKIEFNEKAAASLLDQNKSLVYNVTKLKSPVYLEKRLLAGKKEFTIPQQWKVVEVAAPTKINRQPVMIATAKTRGILEVFKLFGRPKEVLANTIK